MANKNLIAGFGLKLPDKDEIKVKLKKVKDEKKVTKRNTISTKLSLDEKLKIITEEVNRRLGKFKYNTKVIYEKEDLNEYLNQCIKNGIVSIDTETNNSIDPITCKIMGLCLYTPGMPQVYVPINHVNYETGELLKQLTEQDLKEFFINLGNTKIVLIFK